MDSWTHTHTVSVAMNDPVGCEAAFIVIRNGSVTSLAVGSVSVAVRKALVQIFLWLSEIIMLQMSCFCKLNI